MTELFPPDSIAAAKPDPFPPLDRAAYQERCRMRWSGPALTNAFGNWKLWQEIRPTLNEAMLRFRAPEQWDTLTDFLWKLQEEISPGRSNLYPLLDFCERHQKVHLGRGLLIYCEFILKAIKQAETPETPGKCLTCGSEIELVRPGKHQCPKCG